jgi:hypothetical protein
MSLTETNVRYFDRFWASAVSWGDFLEGVEQKADLWASYAGRAKVHGDELARLKAIPGARKILILTEDWCGDAVRSTPTVVAMANAREDFEVRVLNVDGHPAALDSRLTRGARAIPIVIVFDEDGEEIGQWGPRPAPLQAELRAKILTEGSPTAETKGEFYAPIMGWYAKDRGRTVAQEMLMILERGPAS